MKKFFGKMMVLSILAMSFISITAGSVFANSEAMYRSGSMGNYLDHAGVRKAGVGIYEIKGYFYTVDLNTWASWLGSNEYLGSFINPLMTSTDKTNVQSTLAAMAADTDIDYVGLNMIDWDLNPGSDIDPWEIDDIRCDGVVEYAYEWNNIWVWGRSNTGTSSGTPTHFDVSNMSYVGEHQNLGADEPWIETCPLVQRGASGTSWTQLRYTPITD